MPNIVTKTEHHLSKSLEKKADAIAVRVSSVEKEMEQICMDVATDCEELDGETVAAYLKRAFPNQADRSHRHRYLYAGLMLNEGCRRRQRLPRWSVAAEAYSLPPAGYEWFFSQEKPPTLKAVRDWKKYNKPEKEEEKDVSQKYPTDMDDLFTTPPENNVRLRQQQPERSLRSTGGTTDGDTKRSDWFIPDGCPDPEALNAYHDIIHALSQAAELCNEWHSSRRISEELWDSIAGHATGVLSFANSRISTAPDVESGAIDVVGISVTTTEEGAPGTIESD
jgi:hypothetical protein